MVDTETGEFTEKRLMHEGDAVRDSYASLEGPVVVGIEATGAMQWLLELLEELGIECVRLIHYDSIVASHTVFLALLGRAPRVQPTHTDSSAPGLLARLGPPVTPCFEKLP